MCQTCDFEPCMRSCHEAYGYPKAVCVCAFCSDAVYENDRVRIIENGSYVFHEDCLSEMRADEFADYQDIAIQIIN